MSENTYINPLLSMKINIEDAITKEAKRRSAEEEKYIKDHLIGAKIVDIQLKRVPRTRFMCDLIIKTDAGAIPIPNSRNAFFDLSEIKLRVKL